MKYIVLLVVGLWFAAGCLGQQDSIYKHRFNTTKTYIVPASMMVFAIVASRTDAGRDLDEWVKRQLWDDHPHGHTTLDNYLQFAPAVITYGLDWGGLKAKHSFIDRSVIYAMANFIMAGSVFAVKNISNERRPDNSDYYSFPSGHTAEAFVSAELLYQEYRDVSPWIGIGGYCMAGAVGFLRMYNDKHWFHDVVAGAAFGIASTRLAYLLYPLVKRLYDPKHKMHTLVLPFQQRGAWGLTLVRTL